MRLKLPAPIQKAMTIAQSILVILLVVTAPESSPQLYNHTCENQISNRAKSEREYSQTFGIGITIVLAGSLWTFDTRARGCECTIWCPGIQMDKQASWPGEHEEKEGGV